jgi:hypothetical protein
MKQRSQNLLFLNYPNAKPKPTKRKQKTLVMFLKKKKQKFRSKDLETYYF